MSNETLPEYHVVVTIDNSSCKHALHFNRKWTDGDATWDHPNNDFGSIPAGSKRKLLMLGNDRGGLDWYMLPYGNGRKFRVRMAFTCRKSSSNSAEGSQFSGLQRYEAHGEPLELTYVVGTPAQASWYAADEYCPALGCDFDDAMDPPAKVPNNPDGDYRLRVTVDNTLNQQELKLEKIWNDNSGGLDANWSVAPTSVPAGETRTFLLADNDRAGMIYRTPNPFTRGGESIEIRMAFTTPKSSATNAEGSQLAGLRTYHDKGAKPDLHYQVFSQNTAFWHGCTCYPRVRRSSSYAPKQAATWMHDNLAAIGDKHLYDLTIPASHDSTTYAIGYLEDFGIATCQDFNLSEQLDMGIRMLDLRVIRRDSEFWCHHSETCTIRLSDALVQICEFLRGKQEIVLMRFWWRSEELRNEFHTKDDDDIVATLRDSFGDSLITQHERDSTVAELMSKGRRVYVFYDRAEAVAKHDVLHGNPRAIHYPGAVDAFAVKHFLDHHIPNSTGDFIVNEGQCTPTEWTVMTRGSTPHSMNVGSNPTFETAGDTTNPYRSGDARVTEGNDYYFGSSLRIDEWIREEWWGDHLNIVWIDYVGQSDIVQACIDQNLISRMRTT